MSALGKRIRLKKEKTVLDQSESLQALIKKQTAKSDDRPTTMQDLKPGTAGGFKKKFEVRQKAVV
jgi:hypothetical protein